MIRRVIEIDEKKCNGCGACAAACHEGAIGMVDGKAKLLRDDYCDGLGDCLPECPTGAIRFIEREAPAYDEAAVHKNLQQKAEAGQLSPRQAEAYAKVLAAKQNSAAVPFAGCPGKKVMTIHRNVVPAQTETTSPVNSASVAGNAVAATTACPSASAQPVSQLAQWPCQIKLVPINAPYFSGAKLLIAADCTAYAYANFHQDFMRGKVTLIGCPKLDDIDYSEKLTQMIAENDIKSVTILRMEVPCCGGLEQAAKKALQASGKFIPWQVVTIAIDGQILDA